jgi:MEMO1 family protein
MKYCVIFILIFFQGISVQAQAYKLRPLADTVGFAHTKQQMDSIVKRMPHFLIDSLRRTKEDNKIAYKPVYPKVVISPHDDYAYASSLYPLALAELAGSTVIIIGVAHKARKMGIERKLIFDSYSHWKGPYGAVKVSAMREDIVHLLPTGSFEVNDSLQKVEHSVEAMIPFLQYFNPKVEILSILVPAMPYSCMDTLAGYLAKAMQRVFSQRRQTWGRDVSIVISNDAVHYGDEGWGGRNFARYGADSVGYKKAVDFEQQLIQHCLSGVVTAQKIKYFTQQTVQEKDFREYEWTWCGRYSIPFGLFTALRLQELSSSKPLSGILKAYQTSLSNPHIEVDDLGLGVTAPFNIRHWVGYAVINYQD